MITHPQEAGTVPNAAAGTVATPVSAPASAQVASPRPTTAAPAPAGDGEGLAPLFAAHEAQGFRDAWDTVQVGFVDDPKQAVHQADELVAQVMRSLGQSFASERARLEGQARSEQASTEDLRVALRLYRSFLQRLLAF